MDGSLFSESDAGVLALLKGSLTNPRQREQLFDTLGPRTKDPLPLSEIVAIFERYEDLSNIALTSNDIELINFTIKYFENWFYSGEWTRVSQKQNKNPKAYAYFSVPAGIINMLAKLKDSANNNDEQIISFDKTRLNKLQEEVRTFAERFLSEERLKRLLQEKLNPEKKFRVELINSNRARMFDIFNQSERSVENELTGRRGSGSKAPDLYLVKTALIAAEMIRREQMLDPGHYIFIPDKNTIDSSYQRFDFSGGADSFSSMHYHKARLPYAKFLVEYLRTKKK